MKRAINLSKHGLDLVDGSDLFDGRAAYDYGSPRQDEARNVKVAMSDGQLVALVWTERGNAIRLISMRRARRGERREYYTRYGGGSAADD